jgi:diguanylate cyclase (GGDEF)-like protein
MNIYDRAEVTSLPAAEESAYIFDTAQGRALICDVIERSMARNYDVPKSSALVAVSIDNLQSIIDLFGDVVTEPVFTGLAARLRENLRRSDIVARLGENKLGIVLAHVRFNGTPVAVKRVLSLRSKPLLTGEFGAIDLQLSVATVSFPDALITPFEVMTRAEASLAFQQSRQPLELDSPCGERVMTLRRA